MDKKVFGWVFACLLELRAQTWWVGSIHRIVTLCQVIILNSSYNMRYTIKRSFFTTKSVWLSISWFFRVKVQFFNTTFQTVWTYYPASFMVKRLSELRKLALKAERCVCWAPKWQLSEKKKKELSTRWVSIIFYYDCYCKSSYILNSSICNS